MRKTSKLTLGTLSDVVELGLALSGVLGANWALGSTLLVVVRLDTLLVIWILRTLWEKREKGGVSNKFENSVGWEEENARLTQQRW